MIDRKSIYRPLVLAAALFVLSAFSACAKPIPQQEGWTTWRGPNGDSTITDSAFNPKFIDGEKIVLWKTMVGAGYSGLCVSNNRLYTAGRLRDKGKIYDVVYCINSENGKTVWKNRIEQQKEYEWEGPRAMPVVSGESLFIVGSDGDVSALAVGSGKILWKRSVAHEENMQINTWGISGSPVVENGVIYLNIGGGIALEAASGKTIWKGPADERNGYATPVLFDYNGARAIMLFSGNKLLMLAAADGKVIMSYDWVNDWSVNGADPVILDGQKVLISSTYRREGCALLDFSTGAFTQVWNVIGISTHFSSMIEHDGLIYGIHGDTNARGRCAFTCLNPATGEAVWSQSTAMYGSVIKVNDTIIYLDENGNLRTVEPSKTGFVASKAQPILAGRGNSWVAPSYWKGRIYLRGNTGELACIKAD